MNKALILSLLCLLSLPTWANISDISKSDGAYKAIQSSIDKGHLSLFKGDIFNPSQAVTRKEFAIVIDTLIKDSQKKTLSLSTVELQELKHLSDSFKTTFTGMNTQLKTLLHTRQVHTDEIQTLHHDLNKMNAALHAEIQELKKQRVYTWMGIGGAAFLGLLAN